MSQPHKQDPHLPVLLRETLEVFEGKDLKVFFEGTVGAGGHARAILEAHPEIERYLACDRDPRALALAKERLASWGKKVEWIHGPFAELESFLEEKKIDSIDGFLIDVGVSSMQFDEADRGFSFRADAPLDMRMDQTGPLTAEMLVNELPEVELARILYEYGEEYRSRVIAKALVAARKKKRIRTTMDLCHVVEKVIPRGKVHAATKTFQALRIAVNDELGQLKAGLDAAVAALKPGGRLAVITFHSLEDRIVKWKLREEEGLKIITKKPIPPSAEERRKNPRSRSAKLRAAEKVEVV